MNQVRRPPMFSMLMLGCLAAAVGCGGGDVAVPPDQQEALAEIERLHNEINDDYKKTTTIKPELGIVAVNLAGTPADDASMKKLAACVNLEYLDISNTKVTDASLEHIKSFKGLKQLDIVPREKLRQRLDKNGQPVFELIPKNDRNGVPIKDAEGELVMERVPVMENEPILSQESIRILHDELPELAIRPDSTLETEEDPEYARER